MNRQAHKAKPDAHARVRLKPALPRGIDLKRAYEALLTAYQRQQLRKREKES